MISRYSKSKKLKGCMMAIVSLVALSACTDDHFDISSSTATTNLWENIVVTPELDSLKMILERTPVTKDEFDTKSTITYAQLLASSQTFTLWAPKNGTYNAAYWLNLLDQGQGRVVETQFVRNHLARYNYSGSNGDSVRVTMLNTKENIYSPLDAMFHDVPIVDNITASNGSLHLLNGQAQYLSNLYESIEFTPNLDSLYNFLHENDTLIFNESASTPGATINGQIQYVDSVFYRSNTVVGSLNLWKNEDSLLLAFVPTNEAWNQAKSKVSRYYKYKESYPYRLDGSPRVLFTELNADSMSDACVKSAILRNIVSSLYQQPTYDVSQASVEYTDNWLNNADSLVRGGTYSLNNPNIYQPYLGMLNHGLTPIQVSNGFVYPLHDYTLTPSKFWHTTIRVEAENTFYQDVNNFASALQVGNYYGQTTTLTALNRNDSIKGTVSNNAYRVFYGATSASQPTVSFKLPNVKSGKYDIYAVMVPLNMDRPDISTADTKRNRFEATLTYDYRANGRGLTTRATNEEDGSRYFETRPGVVDTVLLFRDYEFPYAYDGVPNAYPTLSLHTVVRTASQRNDFDMALYVDCILLVGKDD